MTKIPRITLLTIFSICLLPLFVACGGGTTVTTTSVPETIEVPTNIPEATEVPPTVPPTNTLPPPTQEPTVIPVVVTEQWLQVEPRGILIVGTSADYPPFEYIDSDTFQLEGFDMALIREVARRLGLEIEFRNLAFDGLVNALQLREIDVAIAAISATVERLAYVDFTNVYYVGADAILAKADSGTIINSVEDMANYRIGVQRGSVYETWIRDELVDTGLIPPENLITYTNTGNAVSALTSDAPEIDLQVIDLLPAREAVAAYPVEIVGQALNQQLYSIAVPKGSTVLLEKLNEALLQMQTDGTIATLAAKYLGLEYEQLLPTPTPGPTPVVTPLPPNTCFDGMAYVADLNYNDQNMTDPPILAPGEAFTKGWRLKNSGTCIWNPSYAMVPISGDFMGGQPTYVVNSVSPGQEYDMYVDMVAPQNPGEFQTFWTMRNSEGTLFGQKVWVGIRVSGGDGGSEPPPQPVIHHFSADPDDLALGQCLTLGWEFSGAQLTVIQIKRDGQVIFESDPISPGNLEDCPSYAGDDIEYRLVVWAEEDVKTNERIYVDVSE